MEANRTAFVSCPSYLDNRGLARCGLPAEIQDHYVVQSTDGPLESARVLCPRGHAFNGSIESLAGHPYQGPASFAARPGRMTPANGAVDDG